MSNVTRERERARYTRTQTSECDGCVNGEAEERMNGWKKGKKHGGRSKVSREGEIVPETE